MIRQLKRTKLFLLQNQSGPMRKFGFLGDNFMANSFAQYFQQAFDSEDREPGHIKKYYDTVGFCSGWPQ